jgi:hypothetical protein
MWSHLLIASNLGVMLFFSVAVAPSIFKVLPAEWAGVYVRQFFPKYYLYLGAVSLIAALLSEEFSFMMNSLVCSLLFIFLALFLTPKINAAKDSNQHKLFNYLHIASVLINFLQMGIYIYLLATLNTSAE